jgi:glycosyltransferase involved in cell wall biosynthesis
MSNSPHNQPAVKVLRIITRLNVGGPAIQAARLTTALEERGYHTRLLHGRLGPQEGDMSDLVAAHGDVRHIASLQRPIAPLDDLRALIVLFRELRAFAPHIVHTHMAKAGLLGRIATVAHNLTRGSAPRARIVHTYHGHVLEGYFRPLVSRMFITLERLLARVSDRLIAISPRIRAELRSVYRIGRDEQYRTVPLGFDLAAFAAIDDNARRAAKRELGLPSEAAAITTVGRLTAIKQTHVFLETIAQLAKRRSHIVGVIAGDGELRDTLTELAGQLGIADRIRWLGWQRNLVPVYAATDVFLLTSRNEGTPVAIIEALASGVPVVSTDVGGVRDVIESRDAGSVVPLGDVPGLVDEVDKWLRDEVRRDRVAASARVRVLDRYGIDRLLHDIDNVYRELLAER